MGPVDLNINNPMNTCSQNLNRTPNRDEFNNTGKNIPNGKNQNVNTSGEQAKKAAEAANSTHLQFQMHDKTGTIMVKIIDDNTGEVIKEIPPEKILDMIAKFEEIDGVFIDEKR